MKGVAHVSFQGGGLIVPAQTPYERQLLFDATMLTNQDPDSPHAPVEEPPAPDAPAHEPEPPIREPQEARWRSGSANCSDASYAQRLQHGRSWGQPQR